MDKLYHIVLDFIRIWNDTITQFILLQNKLIQEKKIS